MIKKLLVAVLFLGTGMAVTADNTPIIITYKKKGGGNPTGGVIGHTPMNLPIDVMFDDATGSLSVSASDDIDGCVYVYDLNGIQEAYSPDLNTTVTLPCTEDIHIIFLQGENWDGEGKIVY